MTLFYFSGRLNSLCMRAFKNYTEKFCNIKTGSLLLITCGVNEQ